MGRFEFTVVATGLDPHAADFEGRFFEAGCDDATVAFQKGHILVDFAREGDGIEDAIASAVENVEATGARVERVEPDPLASLADMAARAGLTRQAMTNYSKGDRGEGFPAPRARVTTGSPLWNWADAAMWLFQRRRVTREVAIEAMVVSEANGLIERGSTRFRRDLHKRVAERLADYAAS